MSNKPRVRKPAIKFIDRLQKELEGAGIRIRRGGMTDYSFDKDGKRSEQSDDHCEWITIVLKNTDGSKKYEVEFYFSNNSKKLESVQLFVKKKKRGYSGGNLIATDKPIGKLEIKKEETAPSNTVSTNGWVSVTI